MELDVLPPLTDVRLPKHLGTRSRNNLKPLLHHPQNLSSPNLKKLLQEPSAGESIFSSYSKPPLAKPRQNLQNAKLSPFSSKYRLEDSDAFSVPDRSEPRLKPTLELPALNIKYPKSARRNQSVMNKTADQNNDNNLSVPEDEELVRAVSDKVEQKLPIESLKDVKVHKHYHACSDPTSPTTPTLPVISNDITPNTLIFGTGATEFMMRRHALSIAQGIRYATRQVAAPPMSQILSKQVALKNSYVEGRRTLVLDLDETLISATCLMGKPKLPSITGNDHNGTSFKVHLRPYAKEFIAEMSKEFEIVIFTAAEKEYAENVVKILDPNREYISDIFHREHCLKTKKGHHIKDLRILKDRDLKHMVIVDNLSYSFCFQIDNGIPILSWEGCQEDTELQYLMEYLKEAKTSEDMREFNKERLQLEKLAHMSPQKFAYGGL